MKRGSSDGAALGKGDKSVKFLKRHPRIDSFSCPLNALMEVRGFVGDHQSCRGVGQNDVTSWAYFALEHASQDSGVGLGVTSFERRTARAG